jgi:hypothetical protein
VDYTRKQIKMNQTLKGMYAQGLISCDGLFAKAVTQNLACDRCVKGAKECTLIAADPAELFNKGTGPWIYCGGCYRLGRTNTCL